MTSWLFCSLHQSPCRVIEEQSLWGQTFCRVWLPEADAVVRVPKDSLQPLEEKKDLEKESDRIAYLSAAAKVAQILEGQVARQDDMVLLAPMESRVIPLPHQLRALSRAVSGDRVRYLLADEVGLGKTIEAGLVIRELKLRGLVRRVLVVAPKGLTTQWVSEMRTHFDETFHLVTPDDLPTLARFGEGRDFEARGSGVFESGEAQRSLFAPMSNPWRFFDQVVVSQDSVKPLEKRRGWTSERIARYNWERFESLVAAGWDLVIVDEAHRLGGSTDQVARYKLGQGLSEAAPYFLLLSATPHQGKTDAFRRLMGLLDDQAFPDEESLARHRVAPYVIRTEKRKAMDAEGQPLFRPRRTELVPVAWSARNGMQRDLYEAVTDYVREGYKQAQREKKPHIGFLMVLMQRLVVSSTRAIRSTLERRLEAISLQKVQGLAGQRGDDNGNDFDPEAWSDMDGQELLDQVLKQEMEALEIETAHVELLLDLARRCEQSGGDAKAEALIERIYALQAEEGDSELKILLFTEFVPTQTMLREYLEARGFDVVCINGSMSMEERQEAQDAFRKSARVLISTDAGGEGLNLQFCHVVINYDLPWNPMRLEQRIGRVDRIGQTRVVRALNLVFEETVEYRVREVLEEKLSVIFREFGIDKTGDVLDSAEAGEWFEGMFVETLMSPEEAQETVERTVDRLSREVAESRRVASRYYVSEDPDPALARNLRGHPLPHWVERMTVSYLRSRGSFPERKRNGWILPWPNGTEMKRVFFSEREAAAHSGTELMNLENPRIRGLALSLGQVSSGQPIPVVRLNALTEGIVGFWGLFEIRLQSVSTLPWQHLNVPKVRRDFMPLFVSEKGKGFLPTGRHIWDLLQSADVEVVDYLSLEESVQIHGHALALAEQHGEGIFRSLEEVYGQTLKREADRGGYAFAVRRKNLERVGLAEVRNFRLRALEKEEREWRSELKRAEKALPDIRLLLGFRVAEEV